MAINHEVKNDALDTPGFLIDKFSKEGRVRVRAISETNTKNKLEFYIENKDLFAHLLKPAVPYNLALVNDQFNFSGYSTTVCPCVFPNGIVSSITFCIADITQLEDFKIAVYGNDRNQFIGATQWFYCEKSQFNTELVSNTTFNYAAIDTKIITPYSYNFVAMQIRGTGLIGRTLTDTAKTGLLQADMQFKFVTDNLAQLKTVTADAVRNKEVTDHVPYIQFDILKGA